MNWDVFISHASEDKEAIARPLAIALEGMGMTVWLDDHELTLGDSLRRSIDRGLSSSQFGVVVLSQSFFAKDWPNKELDGLAAREDGQQKVILPVWHGISREEVYRYSPLLADRLAVSTEGGITVVAQRIGQAIGRARSGQASSRIHVAPPITANTDKVVQINTSPESGLDTFSTGTSAAASISASLIAIALAIYNYRGLGFVSAMLSLSICAAIYFRLVRTQRDSATRISIGIACWIGATLVFWGLVSFGR